MIFLIDTSSLSALVRYHLPFDENKKLLEFLKKKMEDKELLVLDKIANECATWSGGKILEAMDFIKPNQTDTVKVIASMKFRSSFGDKIITSDAAKKLQKHEIEKALLDYYDSADGKLVIYAYTKQALNVNEKFTVITEETPWSNDGKPTKKIPAICKITSVECKDLAEMLKDYKIGMEFITP